MAILDETGLPNVHPLRSGTFVLVWAGQLVSLIGSGISSIALIWWVYVETGSTLLLATVAIAASVPRLVFGPFAGAFADRWDRRRTMLRLDVLSGVATAIIATLILGSTLEVWHLYLLIAVLGMTGVFHATALLASVPNIVHREQLSRANSMMQTSQSASGIIGPAVGGVLVAILGIGLTMWIDAATFFFAAATLLLVSFASPKSAVRQTIAKDILTGFKFLRGSRGLLVMLLLFALANFFLAPLIILLPEVAATTLGMGPEGFGFLSASLAVGLLVGGLLFAIISLTRRFGLYVVLAIASLGAGYVIFGLSTLFFLSAIGLGVMGLAASLANVSSTTVFQREVPLDLQGRVFSARVVVAQGLQPVALALVGILAEVMGVTALLVWSGILMAIAGVISYASPSLRRL